MMNETIILYGNILDPKFKEAHRFLQRMAEEGHARYVLRHYIRARPEKKVRLSGYGVELAIKSTEYKALDDSKVKDDANSATAEDESDIEIEGFDFSTLRRLHPDMSSQLTDLRNHLIDSTNEMAPMKVWQLQDLSYQAAARVLTSPPEEQLKVLKDISQNFPLKVRSLVKQQVTDAMRDEIKKNQRKFQEFDMDSGDSVFLLNGMSIDLDESDIYKILDLLRNEGKLIDGLKKLNLTGNDLQKVLKVNLNTDRPEKYMLDIRDSSVMWMNDVENDEKYERWPSNLHEMLRPAFPGTLRKIRKNMFHLVVVCDPMHEDMKYLVEAAEIFWANDVPLRIGFSFLVDDSAEVDGNSDPGVALVRAYNYARDELDDAEKSIPFLSGIFKSLDEDGIITVDHIKERLNKKFKSANVEDILGPKSEYDDKRTLGKTFHTRTGLTGPVNVLINGILLSDDEIDPENFEQVVVEKILDLTTPIQRAVYMGHLHNSLNIVDYLMTRPGVVPRFNDRILGGASKFIDLLGNAHKDISYWNTAEFKKLSSEDKTATVAKNLAPLYLSKSDSSKYIRPVTMWIVADVEREEGRAFVYNALKHLKSSSHSRIAIIHNPLNRDEIPSAQFIRACEAAVATQSTNHARNFVTKLMKKENADKLGSDSGSVKEFYVGGMDEGKFEKAFNADPKIAVPYVTSQSDWATSVLGLLPGQNAIVTNGKLVGPIGSKEIFTSDDFNLIESLLYSSAAKELEILAKSLRRDFTAPEASDFIMKLTSHLSSQAKSDVDRRDLSPLREDHSVIKLESSEADPSPYDITVVVDPASEKSQEIIPIVMVLRELFDANVKVYMNCKDKLSELPVKRFYRYVAQPELTFKVDNSLSDGPQAKFSDMPSKSILTLTMHPPEGWMAEVVDAVYDLDNIKLEQVKNNLVLAEYELEYLVLEGHARDLTTGTSPRGLQFTLGQNSSTVTMDTIVMANLGYFQMKTKPGVWYLNLRAGRSQEIYQIVSHENMDSTPGSDDAIVLMDSFKSKVIIVKVSKKPDMVDVALLDDENDENKNTEKKDESSGIWNSITSTFTGGSSDESGPESSQPPVNSSDVINIFSLASGHLYERLMRIMMVSVLRHTKTPVKFWVLKNYISPQFKDFIPHMAKEYGFDYELVQYKWPRWLRQQKEKQRTMWGYKILFLDVLFPLGVDKIIFVDADQIVRADLKELRDLDLEGNPYGYTPFCDDKTEMDGFRFWKGGYWASHLAGRKYHISAIYVVDLKKFRLIAAGDRLRGQYQGLSQDPNSLANLDQDLPNNMIHQVGIKSLPQEWLWCATWCSEESKSKAKTIDLCNNPLTKEPKLTAAVRIVKEWSEYDNEIKALQEKVDDEEVEAAKQEIERAESKKPLVHEDL
uniref:UDP-glucose ceramide glucosyltransferase-like 1 n=1 Tax=Phallusia mammillata TaxID=59560 RepID=A0A6F9DXA1_9ASCI|nr:UDP-glucose:glycoprotein glucosyltransferase 1 [Phallusia mammillata]